MKKRFGIALALTALLFALGCGGSTSSGEVLVDINGDKITEGDLEFLGEINPRIQAQIQSPAGRKRILDNLVEQELLYQDAVKEGINRDPVVKAKVDLYRRVIIAQALVEEAIEEAAKKYYEEHPDEFKKLKLSQILIKYATPEEMKKLKGKARKDARTEEQALTLANEVKAKLEKGGDFAKLAKEYSDDAITKARGGDMGLISKDDRRLMARGYGPVVDKAFEMKVGAIGGPVKTQNGYSIVTVTRGIEVEPFEEAQRAILFKVRNDARQDLIANLKKESTIVYPQEEKKQAEREKKKAELQEKAKAAKTEPEKTKVTPVEDVKAAAQKVKAEAMAKEEKKKAAGAAATKK